MSAVRIAALYALVAGAWTVAATLVAGWLAPEPVRLTQLLVLNGLLVVGTSSLLVVALLRREARERERLLAELSGARERIRMLIDEAPLAIATSYNGVVTYANATYAALFGYSSPTELLGRSLLGQIAPRAQDEIDERNRRREAGDEVPASYETVGLRADGSEFPMRAEVASVDLPDGRGTIVYVENIANRREAEAALRLTHRAVDNAWDTILTLRADGGIVDANESACRRLGFSRDELRGMSLWELDPGCPREEWAAHWANVKRRGNLTRETILRARSGRATPVEFAITYFAFEGQEYYIASARDITEHKRLQRQLTAARDAYMTLVQEAPMLVWRTDVHGRCDFVNKRWTQFTGVPQDAALGMGWADWVHEDDRQATVAAMQRGFVALQPFAAEFRLRRQDGALRWVTMRGAPFYDERARFAGFVGTCEDITERKRQQQVKDDFLALASHELKTPLAALMGYADVLQRWSAQHNYGERVDAALEGMIVEGMHLDRLINDLLDVNRLQSDDLRLRHTSFGLAELLEQAVAAQRQAAPERCWELALETDDPVLVCADRQRIEQVLVNLLANAAKYSPQDAPIGLQLRADQQHAMIGVVDHGVGIPATDLPYIFDRFYQVQRPTRESRPGLGLGLYISHEIVRRHGGTIVVSSNEQSGSSFTVVLPRSNQPWEESSSDESHVVRPTH